MKKQETIDRLLNSAKPEIDNIVEKSIKLLGDNDVEITTDEVREKIDNIIKKVSEYSINEVYGKETRKIEKDRFGAPMLEAQHPFHVASLVMDILSYEELDTIIEENIISAIERSNPGKNSYQKDSFGLSLYKSREKNLLTLRCALLHDIIEDKFDGEVSKAFGDKAFSKLLIDIFEEDELETAKRTLEELTFNKNIHREMEEPRFPKTPLRNEGKSYYEDKSEEDWELSEGDRILLDAMRNQEDEEDELVEKQFTQAEIMFEADAYDEYLSNIVKKCLDNYLLNKTENNIAPFIAVVIKFADILVNAQSKQTSRKRLSKTKLQFERIMEYAPELLRIIEKIRPGIIQSIIDAKNPHIIEELKKFETKHGKIYGFAA